MAKRIKNKPRFVLSLLFMGLLAYLLGYGVYTVFFKEELIYRPTYGVIALEKNVKALLVREELLVYTDVIGDATYEAIDGERVHRSAPVAQVKKISEVESDPSPLPAGERAGLVMESEKELDESLETAIEALATVVKQGDYREVSLWQEEIESLLDRQKRIRQAQTSGGENAKALSDTHSDNLLTLRSPSAGILTYTYDGYESLLRLDQLASLDLLTLLEEPVENVDLKQTRITPDQPIFKIIDSSTYYFLFSVDKEESHQYERSKTVEVEVEGHRVSARIDDLFAQKDRLIVLLRSNEPFNHFYKRRQVNARVKIDDFQGLTLHSDSVVQKEGVLGVYRLDQDQRAVFVPVKVLGSAGEQVVVKDGTFIEIEGEDARTVKTVELFHQILRRGEEFQEGDKVQ